MVISIDSDSFMWFEAMGVRERSRLISLADDSPELLLDLMKAFWGFYKLILVIFC